MSRQHGNQPLGGMGIHTYGVFSQAWVYMHMMGFCGHGHKVARGWVHPYPHVQQAMRAWVQNYYSLLQIITHTSIRFYMQGALSPTYASHV